MFDFLSKKFFEIFDFVGKSRVFTQENMAAACKKVQEALIDADVPYSVVEDFVSAVKQDLLGKSLQKNVAADEQFVYAVYSRMVNFLGGPVQKGSFSLQLPSVVMLMGLQGSGKTTTAAKLAYYIQNQAKKKNKTRSILLASVDFYRPAAIDQLEILSKQLNVSFYRAQSADPVLAAVEIYEYSKKNGHELLILDTAGRLHINDEMLEELVLIDKKISPRYKFLVLDAMTGQESLAVARRFDEKVGFQSALLTKLDSNARGGCAFAFRYILKKSILFVGTGERFADLEEFHPDRVAQRMLSFGDIQTLAERLDEKVNNASQDSMYSAIVSGKLTLQDFAAQMDIVDSLGSLDQVVKYIPGMSSKLSQEQLQTGQREMRLFRAIIGSMTTQERLNADLLNDSRKKRIARGAGVLVKDVEMLLERFQHAQQFAKMLKKSGPYKGLFR
jgi:signal recognition particle subunit SRP54